MTSRERLHRGSPGAAVCGLRRPIGRHREVDCGGATFALRAMAVEIPEVLGHPNRLPFVGVPDAGGCGE